MTILDLLQTDPMRWVVIVVGSMLSIVLHELGHGFAALRQGDDTPRLAGHITWNPVVHMGWFSIVLLGIFGIAFGSTPVNPSRFRSRWGEALVSAAGPAVNLVLFGIGGAVLVLLGDEAPTYVRLFFWYLAILNIILLLFNLIPVHPLDGFKVVYGLLPESLADDWMRLAQYGPGILMTLLLLPFVAGFSPISELMVPTVDWLVELFTGV